MWIVCLAADLHEKSNLIFSDCIINKQQNMSFVYTFSLHIKYKIIAPAW